MTMKRERGLKMPEMLDAAIDGRVKAMWIFGYDIAQSDPDIDARRRTRSRASSSSSCQEHLRERDDEVRRRRSCRRRRSSRRRGRSRTPSGACSSSQRRSTPPGEAKTDLEIFKLVSARARPRAALRRARGRDGGDRRADAAASPASPTSGSAARGLQWPVARRRHRRADLLSRSASSARTDCAHLAALPYKPPGNEASDEFPLILVTGRRLEHYNVGTMTRRTGNLELARARRRLEIHPDDATGSGSPTASSSRCAASTASTQIRAALTDRIEPGHVLHRLPLPGGAHEPAARAVGRRRHELPRVQGRAGRRQARRLAFLPA